MTGRLRVLYGARGIPAKGLRHQPNNMTESFPGRRLALASQEAHRMEARLLR